MNLLIERFMLDSVPEVSPRYNIAPTQTVLAVRHPGEAVSLRWGLIPSWAKDDQVGYAMINARAETVATKPAFRSAYKQRRCLILADGYFEWAKKGKVKQPYLYEIDDGAPFAFAGMWESWRERGKETVIESCTIVTTGANELASEIHDRMPVILDQADYTRWLDPRLTDPADLLRQFPDERMSVRPVSTFVNNAKHQGEECVAPPDATSE